MIMNCEGDGPILAIEGNDCQLSGIAFIGTRPGQALVHIRSTEQISVSKCSFHGGMVARNAVLVENSREIEILSCSATAFPLQAGEPPGAITLRSSQGRIAQKQLP